MEQSIEMYDSFSESGEQLFNNRPLPTLVRQTKVSKWNLTENKIYAEFLSKHREKFESEYSRRSNKVYDLLSKEFQNRKVSQCKSHHQKMMKRLVSINNIIKNFLPEKSNNLNQKSISTIQKHESDSIDVDIYENWSNLEDESLYNVLDLSPLQKFYQA